MLGVLLAQDGLFCRNVPVNAQRIIQNADTSIRFRMIEVVTLVLEDGRLAQYGKAVRKTARHKKLPMVFFRQFHSHMLSVSRTSFADVYSHIQHGTFHAAHQFTLRVRRTLEMQSAHYSVGRHTLVVLHKIDFAHLFFKFPLRERFKEIPSGILKNAWFDNHHTLYCCFDYILLSSSSNQELKCFSGIA